jgi:O-antigen/teichoic acid export membrane protein
MLESIILTVRNRIVSAVASFMVIVFVSNRLFAEGAGISGLLLSSINLILLINGFLGGSSLVFVLPKNKSRDFLIKTIMINYLWIVISSTIVSFIFKTANLFPKNLFLHVWILSIIASISFSNAYILLAFENIKKYNNILLYQVLLNFVLFGIFCVLIKNINMKHFFISIYFAYSTALFYSLVNIYRFVEKEILTFQKVSLFRVIKTNLGYGISSQTASLVQFLNYRMGLFLLNKYESVHDVGIFHVGLRLSEAIWMFSSSIALVQYSSVANNADPLKSVQITVNLSKISLLITMTLTVILILVPQSWLSLVFGKDFTNVHKVIFVLATGIVSLGYSTIFSHFFSGTGKYYLNTIASLGGLVVTILGNIILIPRYGIMGAGMASSMSLFVMAIIVIRLFISRTKIKVNTLFINSKDIDKLYKYIKR